MPVGLVILLVSVPLLLAAAIVPWVLIARWKRQRGTDVAAFAQQREWEYRAADPSLLDRFHGKPFKYGRKKAEHVLLGQYDGRPFVAFDLQVDTSTVIGAHAAGGLRWSSVTALDLGAAPPAGLDDDLHSGAAMSLMKPYKGVTWYVDGRSMVMTSPRVLRRPPEEIEERLQRMTQILGMVGRGGWTAR